MFVILNMKSGLGLAISRRLCRMMGGDMASNFPLISLDANISPLYV